MARLGKWQTHELSHFIQNSNPRTHLAPLFFSFEDVPKNLLSKPLKIIFCSASFLHHFSGFSRRKKCSLETHTKSKSLLLSASEPHTLSPTLSCRQWPWLLPIFRLTSPPWLSGRKGVSSLSSTSKNSHTRTPNTDWPRQGGALWWVPQITHWVNV